LRHGKPPPQNRPASASKTTPSEEFPNEARSRLDWSSATATTTWTCSREVERAEIRGTVFWRVLTASGPTQLELGRIASFLLGRRHRLLSGSPDALFDALLARIDPALPPALLAAQEHPSLAELVPAEAREFDRASQNLRRRDLQTMRAPAGLALPITDRRQVLGTCREQPEKRHVLRR
jgi:hypothetical protein